MDVANCSGAYNARWTETAENAHSHVVGTCILLCMEVGVRLDGHYHVMVNAAYM